MDAEALVLAVLDVLPQNEVQGRKRLQKLTFFAVETGVDTDVKFFLHDFGPFSPQVAAATDFLSLVGDIQEREGQYGAAKRYLKIYRLANSNAVSEKLPVPVTAVIDALNKYSTIELEIASTIRHFISKANLSVDDAAEATKELKPAKSAPQILSRAKEALARIGLDERRRENSVSCS